MTTKRLFDVTVSTFYKEFYNSLKIPVVLISRFNNIFFNLALETYVLEHIKPEVPVLYWWRNDKNVVIGRYQNPWKECNLTKMDKNNVALSRRFTGGGAVYQDLGNSCFTFIVPTQYFNLLKNNTIILNVLKKNFNIAGEISGRNDLAIEGRKFSGSAFRVVKNPLAEHPHISLHHGTILINTDFSALQEYLTPNKLKLQSKGVASVSSRVINLSEINPSIDHMALEAPLIKEFLSMYGPKKSILSPKILTIDGPSREFFLKSPEFKKTYDALRDWNWRFGTTPFFSHQFQQRFEWGIVDINFEVKDGTIRNSKIFTDTLYSELIPIWETCLQAVKFNAEDVSKAFQTKLFQKLTRNSIENQITREFYEWICHQIAEISLE